MRHQRSPFKKLPTTLGLAGLTIVATVALGGLTARAQAVIRVQVKGQVEAGKAAPTVAADAKGADSTSPRSDVPTVPTLKLANGGFVAGALVDCAKPGHIRWQGRSFVAPFEFPTNDVNAIQFPAPATNAKPTGDYCFELSGGDVLYGALLGLDDKELELDVPRLGKIHLARNRVERIVRWKDSGDLIYTGPNGLAGWRETSTAKGWREESGQLVSSRHGSTIRGDFQLPARAAVEVDISWKDKPDFDLALGVSDDPKTIARAFHFEVWGGNELVVQRETEQEADVATIQTVAAGAGHAHFIAYLDQTRGRVFVFAPSGRRLADLTVALNNPVTLPSVQLINKGSDIRLERLRISRWNGDAPREVQTDKSRIHMADGTIFYGQVSRFDSKAKVFTVRGDSEEKKVAEDQVASLFLPLSTEKREPTTRVSYQDGTRLTGELSKVEKGDLVFAVDGIREPLRLPAAGLRTLAIVRHVATPVMHEVLAGTLELDGVRLVGHLVEGRETPESSCLAWQPRGSGTASPLRLGLTGRVVYKESTSAHAPTQGPQPAPVQFAGPFRLFLGNGQQSSGAPGRRAIHLRTGDIVPCEVTKIDETGVSFKSTISDSTFVANDKIKAVELASETNDAIRLTRSKRDRLLTVPRMQKDSPPTQMIRSRNGDYLRGRVIMMDAKALQVEVRLETKTVARDRISRIIWLHPEELDPKKADAKPADAKKATRIQTVRSDGIRLTFLADRMADATLSGTSDVLGACRVALKDVDQILIGGAIENAAPQLAYQQWKLQNAIEPKVSQSGADGSNGDGSNGTESELVGKPAPDFKLDLLDGKKFHLAATKGKVVVLDFWATWCGPCVQSMPQVERVTDQLKDQGVQLVAVNLQESPKDIKAMLERQKLHPTVALDLDGVVAEKYSANAIPQTVIIDRDGKVARLFIGGGPNYEDVIRQALVAVLKGNEPEKPKDTK
jgi:thiol-disulfide isomerase/thioredoxin